MDQLPIIALMFSPFTINSLKVFTYNNLQNTKHDIDTTTLPHDLLKDR